MVALAVPQVVTGMWAVLFPQHWFERFPGTDPRLVAAEGPFNAHLATDAGAGFLATGVLLLVAAALGERRAAQLAVWAYLLFAAVHFGYHARNPAAALSGSEQLANAVALGAAVGLSLVLLVGLRVRRSAASGHA